MAVLYGNLLRIKRPGLGHSSVAYQYAQTAMIPTPPAVKTRMILKSWGDSEL